MSGFIFMDKSQIVKRAILEKYNSVHDFAKKIGMPCSTLQTALDKEDGIYSMAAERLIRVCEALKLDIKTLTPVDEEPLLTSDERELLNLYRSLDEYGRAAVKNIASFEYERNLSRD